MCLLNFQNPEKLSGPPPSASGLLSLCKPSGSIDGSAGELERLEQNLSSWSKSLITQDSKDELQCVLELLTPPEEKANESWKLLFSLSLNDDEMLLSAKDLWGRKLR